MGPRFPDTEEVAGNGVQTAPDLPRPGHLTVKCNFCHESAFLGPHSQPPAGGSKAHVTRPRGQHSQATQSLINALRVTGSWKA